MIDINTPPNALMVCIEQSESYHGLSTLTVKSAHNESVNGFEKSNYTNRQTAYKSIDSRNRIADSPYFWIATVLFCSGGVLIFAAMGGQSFLLFLIGTILCALAVFLAPRNSRSENVRVLPVVITELELGNIERHIFAAHFECSKEHDQ